MHATLAGVYEAHTSRQRRWARGAKIALNAAWPDYVTRLEDNLFRPLSPETQGEYGESGGGELVPQEGGKPPKFLALHSSAALLCNLFEPWRHHDAQALAAACGADPRCTLLQFERTRPIRPTWRKPPHLDCEFQGTGARPTAVESKYLEPYCPRKQEDTLHSVYVSYHGLWDQLPRCAALARELYEGQERFVLVNAAQLLRHLLGLVVHYGGVRNFRFLYLFYDVQGEAGEQHRAELDRLRARLDPELEFDTRSYQEVFRALLPALDILPGYRDYLCERYFPPLAGPTRP
jgi:hypothetical protein